VKLKGPFDLPLSLAASASFLPPTAPASTVLRVATTISGRPAIIKVRQMSKIPAEMEASSTMPLDERLLSEMMQWLVSADLDLGPFYRIVEPHPIMGPIAKALRGLKPLRPLTLFEMAIIAITEQQLSLAAAFHIRTRLIERFGTPVGAYWVFPTPAQLAEASLQDLLACGLSRRKAEYVRGIAARTAEGALDLDALKRESDADVRACLMSNRGFGNWSAQYILERGLGRPDCLASDDIGLRRVVGKYLAGGRRLTPEELEQALSPFTPFRGLAAYYLAVHARHRDNPGGEPAVNPSGDRGHAVISLHKLAQTKSRCRAERNSQEATQ
jgi:DNA-3-methyladenine glycosylase II